MNQNDASPCGQSPCDGRKSQEIKPTDAAAKLVRCARTLLYVHCGVVLFLVFWVWGEAPWLRWLQRFHFLAGPVGVINIVIYFASLATLLTPLFLLGVVLAGRGSIRLGATLLTCDAVLALVQWQWLLFLRQ
jgi:hypothetical protein